MVDEILLNQDRQLRILFVDFNAFFASIEQQERPELRDKPVAIAAVETDSTCAIAASYQAKKFGIKCGTPIWEARQKCPELVVLAARPKVYKAYHEAIREVLIRILPEERVHSIDEMSFRLLGNERDPESARGLAVRMKDAISHHIGPCMGCSIGIAPNTFLAKLATELEKPNGLVLLKASDLPGPMLKLPLTGFTGINKKMARRLNAAMIFTAADLYRANRTELRHAFGSVVGERWWYLLRGFELPETERTRQSLSHSHVLAPQLRNLASAREVLLRLLLKASSRLRAVGLLTSGMRLVVKHATGEWVSECRFDPTHDSLSLQAEMLAVWSRCDAVKPLQVGVVLHHLAESEAITRSLFEDEQDQVKVKFSLTLDSVNKKFGKNSVFLAGIHQVKDTADEKIAFDKTWLFSEGRGDNDWGETYRGLTRDLD